MKKSTKIYSWAWAVALVIIIGLVVWPSHHELARDPKKVGAIVNLRLPDIANYEYEDNLDRGASRWDCYSYHAFFAENISEECIAEMERRCVEDSEHWSKNEAEGYYLFTDYGGVDGLYEVGCAIYEDQAHVGYIVSEDEGIFVIAILGIYIQILLIWGFALLVIAIVQKRVMKQLKQEKLNK
ncbi:MAG: hypothetical protein IIX19_06145 [Alistipes sp.]|nr:hypothetical protein [Alistipes sp.]